jgi:putative copper resistance protein D
MEGVNVAMTTVVALLNLGFAVLVGAVLTDWQLQSQTAEWARRRRAPLRAIRLCASLWLGLMLVAVLALEAATMAEVPLAEIGPSLGPLLTGTHFGHVWLGSIGIIAIVLALQCVREVSTLVALLCAAALIAFAVTRSLVSHAVVAGNVSWPVAVETLHLLLISVWLGEVVLSGLYMLRQASGIQVQDRNACRRYIDGLSTTATIALAGIVATGLINTWRGLGSPSHFLDNQWSLILIAKLALVATAAGLGAFNRWIVMPGLLSGLKVGINTDQQQKRFVRVLQVEVVVLGFVLIAAALLSASSPPTAA